MALPKPSITAGDGDTCNLSTPKGLYTPAILQEMLEKSVSKPEDVVVEDGTITVNCADKEAAKASLMTIGVEILDDTVTAYQKAELKINAANGFSPALVGSGENSSWLLIAGRDPVARINLAAQQDVSSIAGFFRTNEYMNSISASFAKHGIAKTLEMIRAEVFEDEMTEPEVDSGADAEETATNAVTSFINAQNMAMQAAAKNLIQSPIKASIFEIVANAGIEDPVAVVEAIYAAMPAHFEVVNAKAQEYMQMTPDALQATANVLASMGVQSVAGTVVPVNAHSRKLQNGNMPIVASFEQHGVNPVRATVQAGKADSVRNLISSSLRGG